MYYDAAAESVQVTPSPELGLFGDYSIADSSASLPQLSFTQVNSAQFLLNSLSASAASNSVFIDGAEYRNENTPDGSFLVPVQHWQNVDEYAARQQRSAERIMRGINAGTFASIGQSYSQMAGASESQQELVLGKGGYRRPDIFFPQTGNIIDGTMGIKSATTPQIKDFLLGTDGTITIVRPVSRGGTYLIPRSTQ